jgi:glycerol uptake facilitator protein
MQTSTFMGELMGSAFLIFLGNAVVANVLLNKTKGQNSGLIVIAFGWAMAVTFGVFVAQKFGSQAAHLNPALTLAFAVQSDDWSNVASFILAQFLGYSIGSFLVYLFYYQHYQETEDAGLIKATFCNNPAIDHTFWNIFSEIIGTAILFIGVSSIYAEAGSGLAPFLVGMLILSIGVSLGGTTGYAINPFRDGVPRLVHGLVPIKHKGGSDWAYGWKPIVGSIIGAIAASLLF